jgi:dTDP-4-dehydrorhamnose 3,5-epimerase-like enzyme
VNIIETAIPGPLIIEPRVFGDARGFDVHSVAQFTRLARAAIQSGNAFRKVMKAGALHIFDLSKRSR